MCISSEKGMSIFHLSMQDLKIKKVISDLKERSDIEGAVLIDGKNNIIACDMPEENIFKPNIPDLLKRLEKWKASTNNISNNSIFTQCILDYNGRKILAKKTKNHTLLVMLQNRGYVSLAMLDVENSVRRIDEIFCEHGLINPIGQVSKASEMH